MIAGAKRYNFQDPSTDVHCHVDFIVQPNPKLGFLNLPRSFRIALQAHLVELERKHKVLESELHDALLHLSTDDLRIVELKRRKLIVNDEIERLRQTSATLH